LTTQNNATQDNQRTSQYGINQAAILEALKAAEAGNMNRAGLDLSRRQFSLAAPADAFLLLNKNEKISISLASEDTGKQTRFLVFSEAQRPILA
jgi:hypothetical protein